MGERQAARRGTNGRVYVDVEHRELGLRIELDGKLFHSSTTDRDRDLDRDLDAAVAGTSVTARLGFGQVYERPCETAAKLAQLMRRLGWTGSPTTCTRCRLVA
jgi:hypothetical protein